MNYSNQIKRIMAELPECCIEYFEDKSKILSVESLYMYGVDLNIFFRYLKDEVSINKDIDLIVLKNITAKDIERYMLYLIQYDRDGKTYKNSSSSKQRKLVVVRSYFSYMMMRGYIDIDPTRDIPVPKKNRRSVSLISQEDVERILTFTKNPDSYKENKKKNEIHRRNMERNYIILLLMLHYHFSPREIAALNVADIKENCIQYHIRGQINEVSISFQHMQELRRYFTGVQNARSSYGRPNRPEDEDALFYSRKRNRISIRNIEVLSAEYKKSGIIEEHRVY